MMTNPDDLTVLTGLAAVTYEAAVRMAAGNPTVAKPKPEDYVHLQGQPVKTTLQPEAAGNYTLGSAHG